jgi:hypothetical protein
MITVYYNFENPLFLEASDFRESRERTKSLQGFISKTMTERDLRCFKNEMVDTPGTTQLNFRHRISSTSRVPILSLLVILPSAFITIAQLGGYLHALKTLIVDCLILPRANPGSLNSLFANLAATPAMSGECSVHYTRFPCRVLLSWHPWGSLDADVQPTCTRPAERLGDAFVGLNARDSVLLDSGVAGLIRDTHP